ncbi:MAG: hypothetical protein GW949_02120 [Spirochaetales bacterium]|nr:hypothetical protein [Spirochaetales bacterium]
MKTLLLGILVGLIPFSLAAQTPLENPGPVQVYLDAELGAVKILSHKIQIGTGGTNFDYVRQGGQEILFPFTRLSAGLEIVDRHRIQFVYQPLSLVTNVRFRSDVVIDSVTFPANSAMEVTYNFPFYRLSYWYDFVPTGPWDVAAGLSVQLRNASIRFERLDGDVPAGVSDSNLTVSQNLGIVPALNFYTKYQFESGFNIALDVVGIYASSQFINGADFEFTGSLLDASLNFGLPLRKEVETYLSLRYFGGGGSGTSEFDNRDVIWSNSDSGYTDNFLSTFIVSLGARVR